MLEYIVTFVVCLVAGALTGLVGIGGGLVIVPAFLILVNVLGIDLSMHLIVGISSSAVFFNSLITLYYRKNEEFLSTNDNIKNSVALIFGSFLGAVTSDYLTDFELNIVFLVTSIASAILLFKTFDCKIEKFLFYRYFLFFISGALSACVGIGGATFFAIILRAFYHKKTKDLLATITLLVAVNAVFAFIGKVCINAIDFSLVPSVILGGAIGSKFGVVFSKKVKSPILRYIMIATIVLGIMTVVFEIFNR
ncbi:MAG: sulfite exporter TauE/SafE family protein [Alphaproteobacteria bacterium]